jgi:RNA-directed DNA polymerase
MGMMEAICNPENMSRAYGQVRANKGAAGVDGMTVHQLRDPLKAHWANRLGLLRLYAP